MVYIFIYLFIYICTTKQIHDFGAIWIWPLDWSMIDFVRFRHDFWNNFESFSAWFDWTDGRWGHELHFINNWFVPSFNDASLNLVTELILFNDWISVCFDNRWPKGSVLSNENVCPYVCMCVPMCVTKKMLLGCTTKKCSVLWNANVCPYVCIFFLNMV